MGKIEICNLRFNKCVEPYDVKVDRSSILGNPFFMSDETKRDEVCDKYEKYFDKRFGSDNAFRREVYRLISIYNRYGKLRLFCWCYPKRCHSAYIRQVIENIINNKENKENDI